MTKQRKVFLLTCFTMIVNTIVISGLTENQIATAYILISGVGSMIPVLKILEGV